MTPEQFQAAQLAAAQAQTIAQCVQAVLTAVAIILGPSIAVYLQRSKEHRDKQINVLLMLMGERFTSRSKTATHALNNIALLFHDKPQVISKWHEYRAELSRPVSDQQNKLWLKLLQTMARELGFTAIDGVDLTEFYTPQGHVDETARQNRILDELLRVLQNSQHIDLARRPPETAVDPH